MDAIKNATLARFNGRAVVIMRQLDNKSFVRFCGSTIADCFWVDNIELGEF